jgi:Rod binding domain-containing protein
VTETTLSAKSYLDFAGLGELRTRAKNNDESAAQEVGRQFEAMFVQMVFKSIREANEPMKAGGTLSNVTITVRPNIEPKIMKSCAPNCPDQS